MPTASARRLMLSSSRGVRLKLSCCDLGSDFRGRAIIFLPWQSACVLGFGGHPLAGPNESPFALGKRISRYPLPQFILFLSNLHRNDLYFANIATADASLQMTKHIQQQTVTS